VKGARDLAAALFWAAAALVVTVLAALVLFNPLTRSPISPVGPGESRPAGLRQRDPAGQCP